MEALQVEEVAPAEWTTALVLVRDIDGDGSVYVLRLSADGLPVAVCGPLRHSEWSDDGGVSVRERWFSVPWSWDTSRIAWAEHIVFEHLDARTIECRQSTRDHSREFVSESA